MTKTYSRNVFSGKQVPFIGISEGHGKLFRGNSVEFSLNLSYNGAIESRVGAEKSSSFAGSIHIGMRGLMRSVCAGNGIYAEETV